MTAGAPDHTIKIYMEKALGFTDKVPVYEIAPVSGRYYATPPTLTDEDFGPALLDGNGRLIVNLNSIASGVSVDADVTDRAARLLGIVYGENAQLQQKTTTNELLTYDAFIESKLTEIDTELGNILTKNTEIDAVLDNILTKNTEIDTVLDNIKTDTAAILTKNTEIDAVLDTIYVDTQTIAGDTTSLDGKLPAAAALDDAISNPTVSGIGAYTLGWKAAPTSRWARALLNPSNIWLQDLYSINQTTLTPADWTPIFQGIIAVATAPTVYNVTMTTADTEYNQALTANTRKFAIMTRDRSEFRFQYVTGKVATPTAPWVTIAENEVYYEDHIKDASITLYFASAEAGKIIEIIEWT